ncbi:hypothetical protein M0R45_014878 [Rubus argutus]|uniref:Uncharacterized protein n=1 Tax=Rubus argutus TaxID=59490 RepID=A0AAW1XNI0_RUBAR
MGRDRNGTVSEKEDESERKSGKAREHSDSESESESKEDTRRIEGRGNRGGGGTAVARTIRIRIPSPRRAGRIRVRSPQARAVVRVRARGGGRGRGGERKTRGGRREKEKKRRRREREEERKKKEKRKKKKKKEKKEKGKKGAVTDLWGKYGIIRETDMWTKRPEFTAWLAEVKQVNLEHLANWEEKQMFKQFMEDHNTATFPSKKYYSLDAYYRHKMEKEMKRGFKKVETERTVFNDEEVRRQEMMRVREKQKEEEVVALKRSMQSGLAQAMKEQAQLREEMAYQYKIGNFEAAAAIQRRLDPDAE